MYRAPSGREPDGVAEVPLPEVLGGEAPDRRVVGGDARHGDVRAGYREVHDRNAALHEARDAGKRHRVGPDGRDHAVAVPGERMVAEPVLDHQVPVVLACIARDAFRPGKAHRADHHKYVFAFHGRYYTTGGRRWQAKRQMQVFEMNMQFPHEKRYTR